MLRLHEATDAKPSRAVLNTKYRKEKRNSARIKKIVNAVPPLIYICISIARRQLMRQFHSIELIAHVIFWFSICCYISFFIQWKEEKKHFVCLSKFVVMFVGFIRCYSLLLSHLLATQSLLFIARSHRRRKSKWYCGKSLYRWGSCVVCCVHFS